MEDGLNLDVFAWHPSTGQFCGPFFGSGKASVVDKESNLGNLHPVVCSYAEEVVAFDVVPKGVGVSGNKA